MEKRVCIITGANAGIGRAAAAQVAARGYHVIMACRNAERAARAQRELQAEVPGCSVEIMPVDMGVQESVRGFATRVERFGRVDVLIHNAAVFDVAQKERQITVEGIETVWSVNHLGPVLLTELLIDQLASSGDGRVITVSSQGLTALPGLRVDLEDPEFEHRRFSVTRAYYQSKRAQVMYTFWLADRLAATRITANCVRVTAVKVDLDRHPNLSAFTRMVYSVKSRFALSPEEMARTYTWLATSDEVTGVTGKCFNEKNIAVKSHRYEVDRARIAAVMALTARYVPELQEVISRDG